ncbi:glycogen/starch synthase [Planctomycetota bacterium]
MDCLVYLHVDGNGACELQNSACLATYLPNDQICFLGAALESTCHLVKERPASYSSLLTNRTLRVRLCDELADGVTLTPHEILLHTELLRVPAAQRSRRKYFLVSLLERVFYQLCHPEVHVNQAAHHSLWFLDDHPRIYAATLKEWEAQKGRPGYVEWLETLCQKDVLVAIERFWAWFGEQSQIKSFWKVKRAYRRREVIRQIWPTYQQQQGATSAALEILEQFSILPAPERACVVIYTLGRSVRQVIRVGPVGNLDALNAPGVCYAKTYDTIRTDIFYDRGSYLTAWLDRLKLYHKDTTLTRLSQDLLSTDMHAVHAALDTLVDKIHRANHRAEALRLLYATLYYWSHPEKGICRAIHLRVNRLLEDLLTERPISFPASRTNYSVFRGEPATVTVQVTKPHRVKRENMRVRVQWSVNGKRKKAFGLTADKPGTAGQSVVVFRGVFPQRRGWIHYATQVCFDGSDNWKYEAYDPQSQGLIKYTADERGQRMLSCYADTFNLRINEHHQPVRDEHGAYVFGSFDTLREQLGDIRAEGYTRIYPLGALELGWPGEAGPDPSVFSIWDGRSVRRDMGGLPALLRLQEEADKLGMKIVLCVVSHFSRAFKDYPYHLPVYIQNDQGRLTRRAGWDGEWDEWLDSFMVNMRDFDNVEYLAGIAEELTSLGFGLRIDVGHGFDTVFPVHHDTHGSAKLLGEVCVPGFEPVDLRGRWQPSIPLLYMAYRAQKKNAQVPVVYAEQWHGNEVRMILAGATPYNALIKNMEHIRAGAEVNQQFGLNENLNYIQRLLDTYGGQTISLFNSHDEESPTSNYQNMIWPVAAYLTFSSNGPLVYHISRLPQEGTGSFRERFDRAYVECWKHWVNNRFSHPWAGEAAAQYGLLSQYPLLNGFGDYLRKLFSFADEHPVLTKGRVTAVHTNDSRIAAFTRSLGEQIFLCVFNFPNGFIDGQAAEARAFNFGLTRADDSQVPAADFDLEAIYEVKERYNNVEGRQGRGLREYWSGTELVHLGFGGVLPPLSSHVYEILCRRQSLPEKFILADSFQRYFRYGRTERVRHTYIASVFRDACLQEQGSFKRFFPLFCAMVTWIHKARKLGIGDLSTLLAEISGDDLLLRQRIITYLMRIAVHRQKDMGNDKREAAADILHSLQVGTIVMVSPESRFSGSSGGVGLYTTDIADVLSEMGFHVVVVTPLYEQNREHVFNLYGPRYEGHKCHVRFPRFNDHTQAVDLEESADRVNFLRAKLHRFTHGKRARVEVLYLENGKYFDRPYSGDTAEDKLRRARLFSQAALEALRSYNYYPSVIQTNEWPTWLIGAYLRPHRSMRQDPHFAHTQVFNMMHNPHPAYSIRMQEANPRKACYYARVLDLEPEADFDTAFSPRMEHGYEIDLTHVMLKTCDFIGTVSNAMRQRILDETNLFGHARLFHAKALHGEFFSRRNGFNMAARQRFWFGTKKSLLETSNRASMRRLFARYTHIKENAKYLLQGDLNIGLTVDCDQNNHVIFGMLHRICRQKGFELLVDWKVYHNEPTPEYRLAPEDMDGNTVLEHFLASDPRIQFVICGRVEDSFDARRYHMHLERIARRPDLRGRFAYYPEGSLPTGLYRNLYLGSQFFVMPSGGDIGEPCGISQQEAHAGGTPVIAHHQDGLQKTVTDADFGDTGQPPNGIKFAGFTGPRLLAALQDAVTIYYQGERRQYRDSQGRPRKLKYTDLCFNAFCTDHRWLRLLRDYVKMYAHMRRVELPQYLDAVQLIVDIMCAGENHPGDAVLRRGMTVAEALDSLKDACDCPVTTVRVAAGKALERLRTLNNKAEG